MVTLGLFHRDIAQLWYRDLCLSYPTETGRREKSADHECRVSRSCLSEIIPDQIEFVHCSTKFLLSDGLLRVCHAMLVCRHCLSIEVPSTRCTNIDRLILSRTDQHE